MPKVKEEQHFSSKFFEDIDKLSESNNYFSPVLRDAVKNIDIKTAKVLDVGCGTGVFLAALISDGCENCYGVDGPSDYVSRAIERGYKEVKVVTDLSNSPLPFANESFDFVVCKDVFEHLLNPVYALSSIRKVLKEDGLFLFHVPNHFPLYGRLKFLLKNDLDTFSFFGGESRWTFPHIRFFEYEDSLQIFADNGFTLTEDLSHHFLLIPFLSSFKIFHPLCRYLVGRYPNQFAAGYTFLLTKNKVNYNSEK